MDNNHRKSSDKGDGNLSKKSLKGWFTRFEFYLNSNKLQTRINIFMSWNNIKEKLGSRKPALRA